MSWWLTFPLFTKKASEEKWQTKPYRFQALSICTPQLADETFLERLHDWVVTVDHKKLGILYVLYATFFLLVGGAEAICIRIQLISQQPFPGPCTFNRLFTMHGTTMVFLMGMPMLFGFANYLFR